MNDDLPPFSQREVAVVLTGEKLDRQLMKASGMKAWGDE
jgi:hypothetical protein